MCRGHSDAVSVSLAMGGGRGVQMLTARGVVSSSNSQDSGPNVSDPLTDRVGTFWWLSWQSYFVLFSSWLSTAS